jgi:hypothetical protein
MNMSGGDRAGFVYILSHVAWQRIGLVKLGMTARDPSKRAAEICSSSGLIAPARVEFCLWVEDRRAVEQAVHAALGRHRVRGRRELFRTDVATARAAIESASCRKAPINLGPIPPLQQRRRSPARLFRVRRWVRPLAAIAMLPVLVWLLGALLHP